MSSCSERIDTVVAFGTFGALGLGRAIVAPEGCDRLLLGGVVLGALGAATTDACSAVWALLIAIFKGKLGDVFRSAASKPGAILIGAAVIGGPLASTCYVLGLQSAGSIIVPISALCPAIGSILSRILFKQPLTPRTLTGIFICFMASAMIGSTGLADNAPPNLFLGLAFGFLAAFGWGLEGCIGGYATSMIDPEIGITIRQVTSALTNLMVLVPLFGHTRGHCGVAVQAMDSNGLSLGLQRARSTARVAELMEQVKRGVGRLGDEDGCHGQIDGGAVQVE